MNKAVVTLLTIEIFEEIKLSANFLIIIPKITGTVTTNAIFSVIAVIVISADIFVTPSKSADFKTIKGTEIILIRLITAVNEIDKATSPFANLVITFVVTPPGAAAIIISPNAISKGKFNISIKIYATIGKSNNWQKNPITKSLGLLITLKKSRPDKPNPRPNIISAKAIGAILVTISTFFILKILLLY